jgi:hypothetical protein
MMIEGLTDEEMKKVEETLIPGLHSSLSSLGQALKGVKDRKGALDDLICEMQEGKEGEKEEDETEEDEDDG